MIRNADFSAMITGLAISGELKNNPDHAITHDFRQFLGGGNLHNASTEKLQVVNQYLQRSIFLRRLGSTKPNSVNSLRDDVQAELATR